MTVQKSKKLMLITVVFLVVQVVAISFGQAFVNSFTSYISQNETQTKSAWASMFHFLLGAQSLHLENFAADFEEAEVDTNEVAAIETALKKSAAVFSNLPNSTTIYVTNKQTRQMVFPKSGAPINLQAVNLTTELLFNDENYTGQSYIIALKKNPVLTYEQARDFYQNPLGTRDRTFIQKIVLPHPTKSSENYVVFAVFEERTLREIVENPVIAKTANEAVNFLIITFSLTLFSTIAFSFYVLTTTIRPQVNHWLTK